MEVVFSHGWLSDTYEEQANKQGFTLGNKAEELEELKRSYNILGLYDCITDSQKEKVLQKIQKNIVKNLKKLN